MQLHACPALLDNYRHERFHHSFDRPIGIARLDRAPDRVSFTQQKRDAQERHVVRTRVCKKRILFLVVVSSEIQVMIERVPSSHALYREEHVLSGLISR